MPDPGHLRERKRPRFPEPEGPAKLPGTPGASQEPVTQYYIHFADQGSNLPGYHQKYRNTLSMTRKKAVARWKYLSDTDFGILLRSDGNTYEYYDTFAKGWQDDPFGAGTFSGSSDDSVRFYEVREGDVPGIVRKISRMRR